MKKQICFYFFLFLFLFFTSNINVLAVGVSKDTILKNKTNNVYELSVGDYLCVYKTQDNKNYIAIKFKKQSSTRYDLMVYHNEGYSYNEFDGIPNTLTYDTNGNLYLKETPNCSDYIYMDNTVDKYYSILSLKNIGNQIEKNDMIFDESLSLLNIQKEDPIVTETPATDLSVDINGTRFYYKEDESGGHFESQTGVWACYVATADLNDLSYKRQAIPLDFNFNDPELVVQIDTVGVCNNGYMILKKNHCKSREWKYFRK